MYHKRHLDEDEISNLSMEHLMRFPACPTTLPRLNTQLSPPISELSTPPLDGRFPMSVSSSLSSASEDSILSDRPTSSLLQDFIIPLKPSSSTHLFKSKFHQAVRRIKGKSDLNRLPQISPKPSASSRMHDQLKGKLNKLFKK